MGTAIHWVDSIRWETWVIGWFLLAALCSSKTSDTWRDMGQR